MVITSKMNMRDLRQHGNDFGVREHHLQVIKHPLVKEVSCCQTVRQCLLLRLRRRNWRHEDKMISDRRHHSMKIGRLPCQGLQPRRIAFAEQDGRLKK